MHTEIPKADEWARRVFSLSNEKAFQEIALDLFSLQYEHNALYRKYCLAIGKTPAFVQDFHQIPFLPIRFFKSHEVKTGEFKPETIFQSSGTTSAVTSRHFVKNLAIYEQSFLACFRKFYGPPDKYCILGLLPSYLEQGASSLVHMVDTLIERSRHPQSGFYLYDHAKLRTTLQELEENGQPAILFGVTYALLDFAAKHAMPLKSTVIVETGGMKGRRKELTKPELYQVLTKAFSLNEVHSEYGMTELLSQAYAIDGRYRCPPWMKVLLRDETDPFSQAPFSGAINVIDLANLWSCCFIETEDLGRLHPDGSFQVLGRMDNTDIRGCSQMTI